MTISQKNKSSNKMIQNLMKQKEGLMKRKNTVKERLIKNGADSKTIQAKMDEFDLQVQQIDEQINQIQLKEQKEKMGIDKKEEKEEKSNNIENKKPNDKANDNNIDESMSNLMNMSYDLSKAQVISSVKNKLSARSKVLKIEIELDAGRGDGTGSSLKQKQMSKINARVKKLSNNELYSIKKINSKLTNSNNSLKKASKKEGSVYLSDSKEENDIHIKQQSLEKKINKYKNNKKQNNTVNISV
jgi:hypothetical protein